MYTYRYTTQQSEEYSKKNKYQIYNTSLSDYDKILTPEGIEKERNFLRSTKNVEILKDTLFYIGTYEEINN